MRGGLLLFALALQAQTPPDPTEVLIHAREKMVERTNRAANYTCVLTINHKYFKPSDAVLRPSCDQLIGKEKRGRPRVLEATDRVRLDVKVSGGMEIGSWAGASEFDSRNILDLARGTFESGTLGPVLQDVFENEATDFSYIPGQRADASAPFEYTFRVPAEASHLYVRAGGDWHSGISYQGSLWIDPASFDLKRIAVRMVDFPEEARTCLATTTADYDRVPIGGGTFLMPRQSVFRALMADSSATESMLEYSGCREYQSQSTVHFDSEQPGAATKPSSAVPAALPAGLGFSVALADPIDTETAAAGDAIRATVRAPGIDRSSGTVLIPSGATVHGRIVRMEHFPGSHFLIGIRLETLEAGGTQAPLFAKPDEKRQKGETEHTELTRPGYHIILPPIGDTVMVAALVFRTRSDRYVVPSGYELNWITVAPPANPDG